MVDMFRNWPAGSSWEQGFTNSSLAHDANNSTMPKTNRWRTLVMELAFIVFQS